MYLENFIANFDKKTFAKSAYLLRILVKVLSTFR